MKTIEIILREEVQQLKKMVVQAQKRLKTAPKGHLRISKKRDRVEYYYKDNGEDRNSANGIYDTSSKLEKGISYKNGRYLKKREEGLARELAQRDYDIHIVKKAEERIKAIDTFLEKYEKTSVKNIYQKTNSYRRELISEAVLSDDVFVKQWQAVEYTGKTFADDSHEIITERGERVRSKSEKIIADKLYALGIPYRYEYPLVLEGNIRIYPDFTILKMPAREEVYLEHLGMMDDRDYVDKVMYKLSTYERQGIYLGVNLFITYETSNRPLNTKTLNGLMSRLFCRE